VGEEATDKIFEVLSHETRRRIIKALAEEGPLSFSEIMEKAGVEDTGTLTFHLRKMSEFLKKNEKGEYELTELGWAAYEVLKSALGRAAREAPARLREEEEPSVVVLGSKPKLVIDKKLLEYAKQRGKKLVIRDVVKLYVAGDVEPELFDEVVEEVRNVLVLRAPRRLRHVVELKCRNVMSIKPSEAVFEALEAPIEAASHAIEEAAESLAQAIASLAEKAPFLVKGELVYAEELPEPRGLSLSLLGGYARVKAGAKAAVRVYSIGFLPCRHSVDQRGGVLYVSARGCRVEVEVPDKALERLDVEVKGGGLEVELPSGALEVNASVTGGTASLRLGGLQRGRASLSVSGGSLDALLAYAGFEGESVLECRLSGGVATVKAEVPRGTRVLHSEGVYGGIARVSIDEELKAPAKAERLLSTRVEVTGGLLKMEVKARQST
jgi:DNA-binding transcriptional ArsR family regulator